MFNAAQEDGGKSTGGGSYTPSILEFSKPPVGQNKFHSVAQIRWCWREYIRIETLRPLLTTNAETNQYEAIVADYEGRCFNFQSRPGTHERARKEVEQMRSQIVANARGMIRWSPSTGPAPKQPRTSQRLQLTIDIQRQLRRLGYNPGPADGIYDSKTKEAIKAFQRKSPWPVDGQPSQELLDRLERVQ